MKNKTVIVTGGSRGIGKAISLAFAKQGANIVINYIKNETDAKKVKEEINNLGSECLIVKGDVGDFEQSKNIVNEAIKHFKTIDILVNNAGITCDTLTLRMKEEEFDRVIRVNLKGTFNMCKHVSRIMMKNRSGKIVNISSVVGKVGNIGQVNYAASKAGIIGITKSLAKELASRNINVNAIAPGFIETDMTDKLPENITNSIKDNIPFKRFGKAEEVANLVIFLSSKNSSYITGQVINIDGGMVM